MTTIEADRELHSRFLDRTRQFAALILRECHRLFQKHMFPGAQCSQGLGRMLRISASDDYGVNARIFENLLVF